MPFPAEPALIGLFIFRGNLPDVGDGNWHVKEGEAKCVSSLFIAITSDGVGVAGVIKKTFTLGTVARIKVLLAGFCPGPGPCGRLDGIRVGLFGGR